MEKGARVRKKAITHLSLMAKAASNGEIVACQKVLTAVSLSEYLAPHAPTSQDIRKITRALIVTKIFFNDIANLRMLAPLYLT